MCFVRVRIIIPRRHTPITFCFVFFRTSRNAKKYGRGPLVVSNKNPIELYYITTKVIKVGVIVLYINFILHTYAFSDIVSEIKRKRFEINQCGLLHV